MPFLRFKHSLRPLTALCCLLAAAVMVCCAPQTVFDRIADGDFSMVNRGRYDRPTVFLDEGREYLPRVLEIRRVIEKHVDLMPLITRRFYAVDRDLVFTYKYVALDTLDRCFILRYFARTHNDLLLAGYEIFFACDTASGQVMRIFTVEVPLE